MSTDRFRITMVKPEEEWQTHLTLRSSATGDTEFCAMTRCTGDCGYPALVFEPPPEEELRVLRAVGSQVACGPLWWALRWSGEVVILPEEHRIESVRTRFWF